jgi:hypothetical protein
MSLCLFDLFTSKDRAAFLVYLDLLQNPCWIPYDDDKGGHVLSDHAACANRDSSADSYTGKHNAVAAKPAVFSDFDGLS